MSKRASFRAALALVMLLALEGGAQALFGGMGGMGGGLPKADPRREDLPYIRCQVCELLAKNAYKTVKKMLRESKPSKKVDELAVIEAMEKLAVPWQAEGEWMARLHLEQQGSKLVLKEMPETGNCDEVCRTVEVAAEAIVGEHDTDMGETLYTGRRNRAQFNNWLCYELTGICSEKPGPMMADMQAAGLKGQMFSRDELLKQQGLGGEGEEDEPSAEEMHEHVKAVAREMDAADATAQDEEL
eukprot:scaffold3.g6608.t1